MLFYKFVILNKNYNEGMCNRDMVYIFFIKVFDKFI